MFPAPAAALSATMVLPVTEEANHRLLPQHQAAITAGVVAVEAAAHHLLPEAGVRLLRVPIPAQVLLPEAAGDCRLRPYLWFLIHPAYLPQE